MAGHSKWANIKHKKEKADAKKGKVFTRSAKEIISAVKLGGPDPKTNPRLRLAIQKAREANFPNDSIERNIKKAMSAEQQDYTEIVYELYGHGGVGILAECMTDNKNRLSSDMRIATNKKGGSVATPGSVSFNFDRKGIILVSKQNAIENELFIIATEAGAEDFEVEDGMYVITTSPVDLIPVKDVLTGKGFKCEEADLEFLPKTSIDCDIETVKENLALIEWLENIDDVDSVYHNMNVPDELI